MISENYRLERGNETNGDEAQRNERKKLQQKEMKKN